MLKLGVRPARIISYSTCNAVAVRESRCFSTSCQNWSDESFATAPKASIDVKHIRQNPDLYSQNCINRNYHGLANYPQQIVETHAKWLEYEQGSQDTRKALKAIEFRIRDTDGELRESLLRKARTYRDSLNGSERVQRGLQDDIERLSEAVPNLMSSEAPVGDEPRVLDIRAPVHVGSGNLRDHVRIGTYLNILNFGAATSTSGWGFYFLLNDGERLEHALVQYARSIAQKRGFMPCSPPSLVYSDIGTACGFRPREQNGEQQVYAIQQTPQDAEARKPSYSLAGTAEIPFAAMHANTVMDYASLPQRIVGSSRSYRAEAGARGRESRGLYRVHEFTKVEMFAWTLPNKEDEAFRGMVSLQKEIIDSLDLPYRVLEMPSQDLGASAYRKQDIEVFFPSRKPLNGGWGEVTSTSICKDYQTRRLNTKVKMPPGSQPHLTFPSTVNGTAMAVPRVLAALLENCWETGEVVRIPEALRPFMGGQKTITRHSLI